MKQSAHKVAGVYASKPDAKKAVAELRDAGIEEERIDLVSTDDVERAADSRGRLDSDTIRDLLLGGAAGAGVGAAGGAALAAIELSVFLAAPVVAAGVGAVIGAAAGGAASTSLREPDFIALVKEALEHDFCVVVVNNDSEAQAIEAQDVIGRTAAKKTIDQHGSEHPQGDTRT